MKDIKKSVLVLLLLLLTVSGYAIRSSTLFFEDLITDKDFQKSITETGQELITVTLKKVLETDTAGKESKGNLEVYKSIVDQAEKNGSLDEIKEVLEKKVKEGKATPQILFTLLMVYERKGMKREAYKTLEKVEKAVKQQPKIAFNLSLVYGRKETLKTAIENDKIKYHTIPGFVAVKGGSYRFGSDKNIIVQDFFIAEKEVTFHDFDLFCTETGRVKPRDNGWGRENNPVINVSWMDAIAYCNWLSARNNLDPCYVIEGNNVSCNFDKDGFRLPTEAEWEFAAKGGINSKNYNFSGSNNPDKCGWYLDNSDGHPHEGGKLVSNELGIYDMSGNVWEWCWDWYSDYKNTDQNSGSGPDSGRYRVLRGGSWSYMKEDISVSSRGRVAPGDKNSNCGFRIVQSIR